MPGVGLEPTSPTRAADFKSAVSAIAPPGRTYTVYFGRWLVTGYSEERRAASAKIAVKSMFHSGVVHSIA